MRIDLSQLGYVMNLCCLGILKQKIQPKVSIGYFVKNMRGISLKIKGKTYG